MNFTRVLFPQNLTFYSIAVWAALFAFFSEVWFVLIHFIYSFMFIYIYILYILQFYIEILEKTPKYIHKMCVHFYLEYSSNEYIFLLEIMRQQLETLYVHGFLLSFFYLPCWVSLGCHPNIFFKERHYLF